MAHDLFDALYDGLGDYTIDERGDVGSWIRMACIRGLTSYSEALFANASTISNFEEYLPPFKYHNAVGGILRQGVERLDNVRQEAGDNLRRLLLLLPPVTTGAERWHIHGNTLMEQLFFRYRVYSLRSLSESPDFIIAKAIPSVGATVVHCSPKLYDCWRLSNIAHRF